MARRAILRRIPANNATGSVGQNGHGQCPLPFSQLRYITFAIAFPCRPRFRALGTIARCPDNNDITPARGEEESTAGGPTEQATFRPAPPMTPSACTSAA
jgi:hypothetical protein